MRKLKDWIKDWLGVADLKKENEALKAAINMQTSRITKRIGELDKLTSIDADVGMRGPCTIILSGVYRGKGYVKFYEMPIDEFKHFVDHHRSQGRETLIRNVDIPYSVRGAFEL